MEKKQKVVALLMQKGSAIDYTPIYTFRATETIRKGDCFEWDSERSELVLVRGVSSPSPIV